MKEEDYRHSFKRAWEENNTNVEISTKDANFDEGESDFDEGESVGGSREKGADMGIRWKLIEKQLPGHVQKPWTWILI